MLARTGKKNVTLFDVVKGGREIQRARILIGVFLCVGFFPLLTTSFVATVSEETLLCPLLAKEDDAVTPGTVSLRENKN